MVNLDVLPHRVQVLRDVCSANVKAQVQEVKVRVDLCLSTFVVIMSLGFRGPGTFLSGSSLLACCS